jgi:hypothetical protein
MFSPVYSKVFHHEKHVDKHPNSTFQVQLSLDSAHRESIVPNLGHSWCFFLALCYDSHFDTTVGTPRMSEPGLQSAIRARTGSRHG